MKTADPREFCCRICGFHARVLRPDGQDALADGVADFNPAVVPRGEVLRVESDGAVGDVVPDAGEAAEDLALAFVEGLVAAVVAVDGVAAAAFSATSLRTEASERR